MRTKRPVAMLLVLLMMVGIFVSMAGCSKQPTKLTKSNEIGHIEMTDVTGLYTNLMTGEQMRDRLVGSWSAVTHLDTLQQRNTLVLTQQNTTITSGDRYELSKDLYNGEMGIHIEARFYGTYTFDDNHVTLQTPEYYTWIYYRNGRITGDSYVYQPVNLETTSSDGCSFFGDYLDYHGYHRVEEMKAFVDPATGGFTFDIVTNEDSQSIGNESEDDGFRAGPIFG